MTLRNYIIIAALGSVLAVRAQEEPAAPVFRPPFDFPLILSGNFGELRSNHFHGGVDFKTQGEVGKPIHCIADGYVSRVLVTPGGYGQAIFITHPNGYTSVYGHVLKFASAVAKVVEEYQYRHETFAVDLKFEPHQVSFKAGEIIALSGNEGYSFGPHLHMEIRRTDTGELIDPLQFYTDKIKDTTPPRASMIMLYPQRGAGVVEGSQRKKSISVASLGQPVSAWGKIAAGISTYRFIVRGRRQPIEEYHPQVKHYLAWNKGNVVQEPGMELVIPRGMLYEDVALNCHVVKDTAAISYEYQLHDEPVALQAGCTLMIGVRHLPVEDTSKYYVARKWGKRKGSAGGIYENGWMKTSIRELGTYTVAIDTLSPRVTPLNKAQWKTGKVQFKIGDAETGIKDYKVKIDGEFALFGFSSKNAKLWMKHPERLKKGVAHKLELVVTDYCGNETKEEYEF